MESWKPKHEFQMKKVMGCVKWSRRVSQMRTRVPSRHSNTMWRSLVTLAREVLSHTAKSRP
jgi:hypothetical protein